MSLDARREDKLRIYIKFITNIYVQAVLHAVNMVLEYLDPEFVKNLKVLRQHILDSPDGDFVLYNPCYIPGNVTISLRSTVCFAHQPIGLAIHFNQAGTIHVDGDSLHLGWDFILPFGRFRECKLKLVPFKLSLPVESGDMAALRGAGVKHQADGWTGTGRMVLVPFVDRRLWAFAHIARPKQVRTFYGDHWKDLRSTIPAKRLHELE